MAEKLMKLRSTKSNGLVLIKNSGPVRLWKSMQINEWTFSLFLFVTSLTIILGKLCINYGNVQQWQGNAKHPVPSIAVLSTVSDTWAIPAMPEIGIKKLAIASEKFGNISNQYEHAASTVISFYKRYGWLIKAAISGLVMTGFSWFVIYEDSSIPGVNPPSPFSPSKHRIAKVPRIQMNYLVGALNGILIFVYMCL